MRRGIIRGLIGLATLCVALTAFAGYKYYMVFMGGGDVYETVPPRLPPMKPDAILIFTKTNGFRHGASIDAATKALVAITAARG